MGAITLDEFSTFLAASLAPVRGAAEHARAALTRTVLQYICQWLQHSMTDYLTVPSLSEILLVMESEKKDAPITPVDAPTAPVEPALSQALAPLSPVERRLRVESAVLEVARELTGSSEAALTIESPLMEAGIDSLAATEFATRLSLSLIHI